MIIINKAILHILDFNSGVMVFSDRELTVENSVETFLLKHIEKSYQDQSLKSGVFYEDSIFKQKLAEYTKESTLTFIDFSRYIVEVMYTAISKSDQLDSTDVLVCDLTIDDVKMISLFKCNNRMGFIHQVIQTEEGIQNDIINHYAIMPNLSQRLDEYAFIDVDSENIKFVDKKYTMDNEEIYMLPQCILECTSIASPKATMLLVSSITKKVAENHGQNSIEAVAMAKSFIAENVQISEYLQPTEVGKEIFKNSPLMQSEYLTEIQTAGIAETVKVEQAFALKKMKNHKIKTDTGIELTIPLDYFQNTDYVEFINNPDGTLAINLKNIIKLTNKS